MKREVPGVMPKEQGKDLGHLSLGRMSTAPGKERPAAAGDAGETAACPGSTTSPRGLVLDADGLPSWWERYFH